MNYQEITPVMEEVITLFLSTSTNNPGFEEEIQNEI